MMTRTKMNRTKGTHMLMQVQRKQFKVARGKPRIHPTTAQNRARRIKPSIFDATNDESTMHSLGDASSIAYDGLQLSPLTRQPASSALKTMHRDDHTASSTYYRYIQKLVRIAFPDHERALSGAGKTTLNDFTHQMFELIAELASEMLKSTDRRTMTEWDIHSAARLLLPGGLLVDAHAFAVDKMDKLRQSRSGRK